MTATMERVATEVPIAVWYLISVRFVSLKVYKFSVQNTSHGRVSTSQNGFVEVGCDGTFRTESAGSRPDAQSLGRMFLLVLVRYGVREGCPDCRISCTSTRPFQTPGGG